MWTAKPTSPKWPDFLLSLILTVLPFLFFWRLVTPNPVDRMQIAAGDFTEQYFPLRAFIAQQWVNGEVPLWNPYLYGGQPALADIQSGALYPPHVLQALILGWGGPLLGREIGFPVEALEWQVIFHFSLAAVGTYLFVRHLVLLDRSRGLSRSVPIHQARFGGFIAALVFTYGGYLTGFPVQQMTILSVSAWLPWVLWGLSAALARPFRAVLRPIAGTALALALAVLAGHPQTVLYIFYLTLAYALFRAFFGYGGTDEGEGEAKAAKRFLSQRAGVRAAAPTWPPRRQVYRRLLNNVGVWAVSITLGLSIAAAQLLPTLEFIDRSLRADLDYDAVSAGLPLTELVSILYPGFFGGSPAYVGIATLVLIALALVLVRPRAEIFFWVGAGLVSLLLAFGGNLFLYPLFYLLAPGFDAVRQQERAFLVYSFSGAVLAGFGAVVLAGPLPKPASTVFTRFERRLQIVALVALVLTAFFIYGSTAATARGDEVNLFFGVLRHHLFGLLILGGMLLLLRLRARRRLRRPWGLALVALLVGYNLFTVNWRFNLQPLESPRPFASNSAVQFLQSHLDPPLARLSSGGLLPGGNSAASIYTVQDLTGNSPLQLAAVDAFLQQLPAWRAWQLMNVRYVVDTRDIGDGGLAPAFEGDGLKIYQMRDPFERVWPVNQVEVVTDFSATLQRLADDSFDLRRTAIVSEPPEIGLASDPQAAIQIIDFSPNALHFTTESSAPQLLVVSQIFYPGWQATIDGQPAELLLVNGVLQGLTVPSGTHTIRLAFWPASFTTGLWISAAGLLICLVLLLSSQTPSRRSQSDS